PAEVAALAAGRRVLARRCRALGMGETWSARCTDVQLLGGDQLQVVARRRPDVESEDAAGPALQLGVVDERVLDEEARAGRVLDHRDENEVGKKVLEKRPQNADVRTLVEE